MVTRPEHFDAAQALRLAQDTFDIEAAAILGLKARTGAAFTDAVERVLSMHGRVVVMGMGKSGHVGRKIAATLAALAHAHHHDAAPHLQHQVHGAAERLAGATLQAQHGGGFDLEGLVGQAQGAGGIESHRAILWPAQGAR